MLMRQGQPYPLGSTVIRDAGGQVRGVNFALFSAHATEVELCCFVQEIGGHWREIARYVLPEHRQQIWCGFLEGAEVGLCYGYRIKGPYQPHLGHRFNANKLLLDPYARWLKGNLQPGPWMLGYARVDESGKPLDVERQLEQSDSDRDIANRQKVAADGDIGDDTLINGVDNAWAMPRSVVVEDKPYAGERLPSRPLVSEVILELHVKGFTQQFPAIDERLKGTYAGLGSPEVIEYLQSLGVTCVELLPVHSFFSEPFLNDKGMSNYWGYNSVGFFCPHRGYCATDDGIGEFQQMVAKFHQAGIRVILDVVYNHTAEGNRLGPIYNFRGIDNLSYYRLHPNDKRFYINDTGCGNCLDISHPRVLQMVMDSLRYWVSVMGVDGFRFDLASCLGREPNGFATGAGFFDALLQDPVLSGAIMIAEPWDIGPGGYQLGQFPLPFSEWNDRYRDTVRRFWRGDLGMLPELAKRLHGSGDLFEHSGRGPCSSVNFITSHDGFTLADLVSYEQRHNEANGEENRDGHHENFSANNGIEGPSDDAEIVALRQRQQRNILATLLLSQGVPMMLAGDEQGNSQRGNNNAYCQDSPIGWLDWSSDAAADAMRQFCQRVISLRRQSSIFQSPEFIHSSDPTERQVLGWYDRLGDAMTWKHWAEGHCRSLQLLQKMTDDEGNIEMLLLLLHAAEEPREFVVPEILVGCRWQPLLCTTSATGQPQHPNARYAAGKTLLLEPRSLKLLGAVMPGEQGYGKRSNA
ncbi:glycogen debranching protein GlgX [Shewanella mangrovi]|uniref:glycogen debranching protein GlgX n=1 Tax=Shewanella mangrovi TaxID=1515746 RepID=UPI00056CED94|nr:glycogen debranching protein GlgX [Shewanella mangrovi]